MAPAKAIVPFMDLGLQFQAIERDLLPAMLEVLNSGEYIMGPQVRQFEEQFAAFTGARHCIGVASGTAALEIALRALGVGPRHEVIIPANTYIASAMAISATGAAPVLVDIDSVYSIDVAQLESKITSRTCAIMPVHLFGQPANMAAIQEIARRHELSVIEDASQAHGARYNGRHVGTLGDIGCFSFHPTKNLGALGDAGAIVTNDSSHAAFANRFREFGQTTKHVHVEKGTNFRLDTLFAIGLLIKLRRLNDWNRKRRALAGLYDRLLESIDIAPARHSRTDGSVYHLYVIELDRRDEIRERLALSGVETAVHYPRPIHLQPAYAELGRGAGAFPAAESAAESMLSLPLYPEMTEQQVEYVVRNLAAALKSLVAQRAT